VLPLPLDLAMGLSVPVIVGLMWILMRRLRRGPDDSRH
jgi:hypothetical protein